MCPFLLLPPRSRCSDRRKSFGPSVPIAYATYVSPPNEAAAWPRTQVSGAGYGGRFARCRCLVLDMAAAWPAWRCRMANYATGCPWHSSCKSSRTLTHTATYDARIIHQCRALCPNKRGRPTSIGRPLLFCSCLGVFTLQAAICSVLERRSRPLPALRYPCPAHQYKKSAALVCLCHRISCQTQITVVEEAD